MNPQNEISARRYILLDTCIFKHLDNHELRAQIIGMFEELTKKGYVPCLSRITIFELIDTASVENEMKVMDNILGIKVFEIDERVIFAAGHIGSMYKDDRLDKTPEVGDKIIAATAALNKTLIFTTNGRDFPLPFFSPIDKPLLKYSKQGREILLPGYFLEPDINILDLKYQEREKESQDIIQTRLKELEIKQKELQAPK